MYRRRFVTVATVSAIPLAGCTGPEDGGEDGENGGSGPYGKVDGHDRLPAP